jgi:hypothetical protein
MLDIKTILRELLRPWETIRRVKKLGYRLDALSDELKEVKDDVIFSIGQSLAKSQRCDYESVRQAEFRVFSQYGEDGIIQFLVRLLGDRISHTFVEFGVQDYREANTLFLAMNNGWRGTVIDADAAYIDLIKARGLAWKYGVEAICAEITPENINDVLPSGDLGLLSIDVDGIDWHLWKALAIRPAIVVIEYNRLLPLNRPVVVPRVHSVSNVGAHKWYSGASLSAMNVLAQDIGYSFVGVESHQVNAFFVRNDLASLVPADRPIPAYVSAECERVVSTLRGLPIYNAETKGLELL